MPVLLFCHCGSDRVDIKLWNNRRAQLHCFTCGQEAWLEGFTVSEFDPAKLLTSAVVDQARKHRKRPPDEIRRIEEHRKRARATALEHPGRLDNDRGVPRSPAKRNSPRFIQPMAARVVDKLPEGEEWTYEMKFDGYRALLMKDRERVQIRSRNDKDLTSAYPKLPQQDVGCTRTK